jgi:hypothetical protein
MTPPTPPILLVRAAAGREESARKLLDALTRLCTLAQGGLDASADDAPPPRPRLTIVPKDPL